MNFDEGVDFCESIDSVLIEPRVEEVFNDALAVAQAMMVEAIWIGVVDTQEENRCLGIHVLMMS